MTTNAEKLVAAEAAYHKLVIGTAARVVVDQNGERVEFTAASRAALYNYILTLRTEIAGGNSVPLARQPLRFVF